MNFTNQELIQELEKRIKEGTLEARVVATEVKETSKTLLSFLDSKDLLMLVGLTAAAVLLFCYSLKVTSNRAAEVEIEFDQQPPSKVKLLVEET